MLAAMLLFGHTKLLHTLVGLGPAVVWTHKTTAHTGRIGPCCCLDTQNYCTHW